MPWNAGTITACSFTLVDAAGQPVAGAVTTNVDVSEATLTLAVALGYGQQYTAWLAGTIRTRAGGAWARMLSRFTVERDPVTTTYLPLVVKEGGQDEAKIQCHPGACAFLCRPA